MRALQLSQYISSGTADRILNAAKNGQSLYAASRNQGIGAFIDSILEFFGLGQNVHKAALAKKFLNALSNEVEVEAGMTKTVAREFNCGSSLRNGEAKLSKSFKILDKEYALVESKWSYIQRLKNVRGVPKNINNDCLYVSFVKLNFQGEPETVISYSEDLTFKGIFKNHAHEMI